MMKPDPQSQGATLIRVIELINICSTERNAWLVYIQTISCLVNYHTSGDT